MKCPLRNAAAMLAILLCATISGAEKPKTVDDAVQVLKTKWLKPKDRDWILRNTKEEVWGRLYMGFGTGLRNEFGLWGDNQSLRDSCGTNDPEGCSSLILERLWESVRSDADPTLVHQLDCQFQLAKSIRVSLKGFHQLTTREMIKRLQSQIDSQVLTLTTAPNSNCNNSLTLNVAGDPDLGCFVWAPHKKQERNSWDDLTLEHALAVLGTQNMFRTVHNPPTITLDFFRKCQFREPFPY